MIYIIMALYPEAQPLIGTLGLKRAKTKEIYDSFQDENKEITLVLTGMGKVRAAVAVSHICTKYHVGAEDFLLHIGSCAGKEIGKLYVVNQIEDSETERRYYPDILFPHHLPERGIVTVGTVLEKGLPEPEMPYGMDDIGDPYRIKGNVPEQERLYDMESSGVYQGCVPYLGQHQMAFLKVVSDAGKGREITSAGLREIMAQNIPAMVELIDSIRRYVDSLRRSRPNDVEVQWRERLYRALHCSVAMEVQAEQLLHYLWLSGRDYHAGIDEDFQAGRLPCKDRKEGKKYLEELKGRLL